MTDDKADDKGEKANFSRNGPHGLKCIASSKIVEIIMKNNKMIVKTVR